MKKVLIMPSIVMAIGLSCIAFGIVTACKQSEKKETVCPYEKEECPEPGCSNFPQSHNYRNAVQFVSAGDYQLELIEDSVLVWDGRRYVGTIPLWDKSPLDSLITKDNE